MASQNVVELVLKAIDQASGTMRQVGEEVKRLGGATGSAGEEAKKAGDSMVKGSGQIDEMGRASQRSSVEMWGLSAAADAAFGAVTVAIIGAFAAQQDYKNSLLGLSSVAAGLQQDTDLAKQAAVELAKDGLMSVADAATSLKNLLAARFGLPEAISIIERFKDSAAFGRQASLSFGDAVRSATEGIKNGNSILVDNAGVTKNLSIMLEEAGLSAQDLMRASEDVSVRMAIYNGIMRETQHQVGDAAKLSSELSGELSKTSVSVREVGIQVGTALEPALRNALSIVTPLLGRLAEWVSANPQLAATVGIVTVALLGMAAAGATLATFVLPALSAAFAFLATPIGAAALAVSAVTAILLAQAAAAGEADNALRNLAQTQQEEAEITQTQIAAVTAAGEEYAKLKQQIESGKMTLEQEQKAKADLIIVEQRLRSELGQEGLARIKNAEDTQAAVNTELAALQEKLRVQKEALQKTLLMENEQTLSKIDNTQKRIEAVEKEARVYSVWGRIMETGEKAAAWFNETLADINDAIASRLPEDMQKNAKAQSDMLRGIAADHQKTLEELYNSERSEEISRLVGELTNLRHGLNDVNMGLDVNVTSANNAARAGDKNKDSAKKQAEALSQQEFELQKLDKRWAAYEAAAGDSAKSIDFLASKKEYLAVKIELLNGIIGETTTELDKAAAAKNRDEAEVQKLTLKILDLQATQAGLKKQISDTTAEMTRQTTALIQHETTMRRLSVDQQIEAYRRLRSVHEENSREIWQIDEQLARLYGDRIQDALKSVERAYQEQLSAIDTATESTTNNIRRQMDELDQETNDTIKGLQQLLDEMDDHDLLQDREKARSEHEKTLQELRDDRHYHELRTGKEHQKAIADIDKQIAEEEQRWAEQQEQWAEDDRRREIQDQIEHVREQADIERESLQDQMDRAQENAAQQRKALQEHYDKVTALTEEGIWDSIAAMAATEPEWFSTGQKLIGALVAGIQTGQVNLNNEAGDVLDQIRTGIEGAQSQGGSNAGGGSQRQPVATIPRSAYETVSNQAVMPSRSLADLLGVGVTWDGARQMVQIGTQWFAPVKMENNQSFVSVRQVAAALGHQVEHDNVTGTIRIYHVGGRVDRTGPAILEEGEYVLNRRVVNEVRGSTPPAQDLASVIMDILTRILLALESSRPGLVVQGPLVHNAQVVLPAESGSWLPEMTEGAQSWIRGGR